jgi:serine/threonine protein kinase
MDWPAAPARKSTKALLALRANRIVFEGGMAEELVGNYRLVKCILTGQSTQVWEVVEQSSHRHFAMKLLLQDRHNDSAAKGMLYHEAEVGLKMTHPNVIKIVYVSNDKTNHYFVMEFFPSGSLKSRLVQKQFDFVREHAHSLFKQAATGFAYITASGFVHRDIKPDNLLVNGKGELRIIDFAIAQRIETESFLTKLFRRKPAIQGTRSYMSPEQIRGLMLDGRADIYSYGATLFELIAHRPPFRAATQQELLQKHIIEKPPPLISLCPDVTPECNDLIQRCLAKKPADRPQTFHDVLKALNQIRIYKGDVARKKNEG